MTDLAPGQVTLADLFRVMSAIQGDLAKVATRLEVIDSRNQHADALDTDHEKRIRALEAFRWKLVGMAIVLSVVCGLLSGYLAWALERGH